MLGGLNFPLASDRWPYAETAKAFGLFPAARHRAPFFNDRAAFIVDKNGKVAWCKVYEVKTNPDLTEILEALKKFA